MSLLELSGILSTGLWLVSLSATISLGCSLLSGRRLTERQAGTIVSLSATIGLVLSLFILTVNLMEYPEFTETYLGNWLQFGHYHFELEIDITLYTAIFLVVSHVIFCVVAHFARNYLLRDPGYQRFMLLFSILQFGLILIASAGSMELLVIGWEIVGMASFLLIGFFVRQRTTGERSLNAFVSYKIADCALIFAALLVHHAPLELSLDRVQEFADAMLQSGQGDQLFLIGLAIIFGSLAKGSQFPFITWMPRAMEGPTPSSAAFYGGLSVHLAPLLLIRTCSVWFWSPELRTLVAGTGLLTAIPATLIGRTQANVKGQLSYAVMAQIGLIYVELACGFVGLALAHMVGHASLRTVQYLRSSSVLADFTRNRLMLPGTRPTTMAAWNRTIFIHAWNGFYWETFVSRFVVAPVMALASFANDLLTKPCRAVLPAKQMKREANS